MNQKSPLHHFLLATILLSIFISNFNIVSAREIPNVLKSDTMLYLEDNKIPITVYKIENKDYVPLVSIINFFGMEADFDNHHQIVITQNETINVQKEFYNFIDEGQHTIQNSTHTMEFYGNRFSVPDLKLVDNYNFIPVSELADFFGYQLLYDKIPNAVVMSNDYFYSLDKETLVKYSQYMKENKIDFTLDDDMDALKAIDFENYNVYLLGENHAIDKNADMKLNFIKFLYKNYGVRYIIDESGYCDTIMLNRFLQTGDTSILEKIIESFKRTFSYTKENYDFYIKLYEFNQSLPENEKIVIVGIDVQHNWKNGLNVIKLLTDESKEMPDIVKSVFDTINKEGLNHDEMKSVLDIVDKNEFQFKQYFGENYLDFYFGIRSIWQSMEFYVEEDFSLRERFIHENISDLYAMFDMQKCFGMFGGAHTMLNGTFDEDKNLAQYLNTEFEPARNKVLSIMCMYENSCYMDKYTGASISVYPNYGKTLNKVLAEAVIGDYGICPVGEIKFYDDSTLSDMFQYMLCVKNSPASTPFRSLDE